MSVEKHLNNAPELAAVVVTTAHRGVFFGYGMPTDADTIRLERARMCVYWSADMRGVLGLAAQGPSDTCRIGPAVPVLILRAVMAVLVCSDEAVARWEAGPWD